jgi:hypothetical protein
MKQANACCGLSQHNQSVFSRVNEKPTSNLRHVAAATWQLAIVAADGGTAIQLAGSNGLARGSAIKQ